MIFNPYLVGVSIVTSVGSMPLLLSVVWWVNFSLIFILQALNVFWFYKVSREVQAQRFHGVEHELVLSPFCR